MKTIQIVLPERLLRAADRAAQKAKTNRSALFRAALQEHLKRQRTHELEASERRAYEQHPLTELVEWEKVLSWPEE